MRNSQQDNCGYLLLVTNKSNHESVLVVTALKHCTVIHKSTVAPCSLSRKGIKHFDKSLIAIRYTLIIIQLTHDS